MTGATIGDSANHCQGGLGEIAQESWLESSRDLRSLHASAAIAAIVGPVGPLTDLGAALRKLRGARPQADVARASGLAASVINRVEKGHQAPSVASLDALLTAMGLTLHDLAEALDQVAGRAAPARVGKVNHDLVASVVARGALTADFLDGVVSLVPAGSATTAADLVATAEAAAAALARQALERAGKGV